VKEKVEDCQDLEPCLLPVAALVLVEARLLRRVTPVHPVVVDRLAVLVGLVILEKMAVRVVQVVETLVAVAAVALLLSEVTAPAVLVALAVQVRQTQ
jgi:hypothetical protein